MEKEIKLENVAKYKENFESCKKNKLLANAVLKNGIGACAFNAEEANKLQNVFNVEIKDFPSVTNQKQSGRCWMFASLNMIRPTLAKNLKVKDIELSEAYLFFFDKLEKCNFFLEKVIDNINVDDEERVFDSFGFIGGNFDGGYFHYFKGLVEKYGIVPIDVMKESVASSASGELDEILKMLLAKDRSILKNSYNKENDINKLRELKDSMLNEIYRILAMSIGNPVNKFSYDYRNTDDEFVHLEMTPVEFYQKYVAMDLNEYVILVTHDNEKYPFYQRFSNVYAKNMQDQIYDVLNVPLADFKESAIKSLKDNSAMWFACDVGAFVDRKTGILSTKVMQYEDLFNISLDYDKFTRVKYGASYWNHAMTLTGVNIESNNKPSRWKIQNSWGTETGDKGIYIMSDEWFDKFVYMVVVNKKYLSNEALKALDGKVIELVSWDVVA